MRMVPVSGSSSPAIIEISVVLPLPEKPTIATNSPASIARFTSCRTSVRCAPSPYDLLNPESSSSAIREPSAPRAESEQALQPVHRSVEQEADEADGEYGHHDSCE